MRAANKRDLTFDFGSADLFENGEGDEIFPRRIDLGEVNLAIIRDFVFLPGFHAQNARKVMRGIAANASASVSNFVDKETTPRHVKQSSFMGPGLQSGAPI